MSDHENDAALDWGDAVDVDAPPEAQAGRGSGWTAVGDSDFDRIRHLYPGEMTGTTLAVYYVLLREARYKRSLRFKLSEAIAADRAGIARNTLRAARARLAKAGLLRCTQRRLADGNNDLTEYRLTPAVSPVRGGSTAEQPPRATIEQGTCSTTEQPPCAMHNPPAIAHSLRRLSPSGGEEPSKKKRFHGRAVSAGADRARGAVAWVPKRRDG